MSRALLRWWYCWLWCLKGRMLVVEVMSKFEVLMVVIVGVRSVMVVCLILVMLLMMIQRLPEAADAGILYTHPPFTIPSIAAPQSSDKAEAHHASLSSSKQLPLLSQQTSQLRTSMTVPDDSETASPLSLRSPLSIDHQTGLMLLPTAAACYCLALVSLAQAMETGGHWGCIRDLRHGI